MIYKLNILASQLLYEVTTDSIKPNLDPSYWRRPEFPNDQTAILGNNVGMMGVSMEELGGRGDYKFGTRPGGGGARLESQHSGGRGRWIFVSSRPAWSTRASSRTGSKATEKPCLEK